MQKCTFHPHYGAPPASSHSQLRPASRRSFFTKTGMLCCKLLLCSAILGKRLFRVGMHLNLGTGWYSTTVFYNFFLTDIKKLINCKTQPISSSLYIDILIFWCLSMVIWTKSCIPQHCQNMVISLSKIISTGLSTQTHLWTYLCTAVIPKYHLDTPKHHSRHPHMFKTDYRHQHTPTDTNRHHQTFSNTPRHHSGGGWQCLGVPGALLRCLVLILNVLSRDVLCCLGVDRKMLRAVWDAFMGVCRIGDVQICNFSSAAYHLFVILYQL